jgi:hypothetical protein
MGYVRGLNIGADYKKALGSYDADLYRALAGSKNSPLSRPFSGL